MTRLEHVRIVAKRHGATLPEYLILHIATAFAMTQQEAVKFCNRALARSNYTNVRCEDALESCLRKDWVALSPYGKIVLTGNGLAVIDAVADDLTPKR